MLKKKPRAKAVSVLIERLHLMISLMAERGIPVRLASSAWLSLKPSRNSSCRTRPGVARSMADDAVFMVVWGRFSGNR